MRTHLRSWVRSLIAFSWSFMTAQSYAQGTSSVPLNQAIALATRHSFKLRSDSLQTLVDQSKVKQAKSAYLPQLTTNISFLRLSNNIKPTVIEFPTGAFALNPQILNQSYNSAQLMELISSGGKIHYAVGAAKLEVQAGKADYLKSKLDISYQVASLWYNLYSARDSKEIILANIQSLVARRHDLENLRSQGILLENDVLKLDLSITELKSSLVDLSAAIGNLNFALCTLMGVDSSTRVDIPYNPKIDAVSPASHEVYVSSALTNRAEIKGLQFRREAANFALKATRADYFPVIGVIGQYDYNKPTQRIIPNTNQFAYSAYVGANLTWKLSAFYTNGPHVREIQYNLSRVDAAINGLRDQIAVEVDANYRNYIKSMEKINLSKTELAQATENFRVEENKLKAGTTTPTDFLEANTRLLQAKLNISTSNASSALAYYKLINSTGSVIY